MLENLSSYTTLSNEVKMPWMGFGVYQVEDGEETVASVVSAINHGYRSIDTASFYGNEKSVGEALKQVEVPREDLFITTKVWNDEQGYDQTLAAFERSREKLGIDVVDLYLVHWPVTGMYKETWQAMEALYREGKVRAIGVCNFNIEHLEDLMESAEVNPMVNQVEYHPRLVQLDLLQFCKDHQIQMEAWAPLMRAKVFDHPTIVGLSEKYDKTPAQIVLRRALQQGVVTIPKSVHEKRIQENADVFDFELTNEEIASIDELHTGERVGPNPKEF